MKLEITIESEGDDTHMATITARFINGLDCLANYESTRPTVREAFDASTGFLNMVLSQETKAKPK